MGRSTALDQTRLKTYNSVLFKRNSYNHLLPLIYPVLLALPLLQKSFAHLILIQSRNLSQFTANLGFQQFKICGKWGGKLVHIPFIQLNC